MRAIFVHMTLKSNATMGIQERAPLTLYRASVLASADERRKALRRTTVAARRARLGQFFTPAPLARFMASMFELEPGPASLLDPGAGVGALSAAFADRWEQRDNGHLTVTAIEVDPDLRPLLHATLSELASPLVELRQIEANFIQWMTSRDTLLHTDSGHFDYAILNPPYRKISGQSQDRADLRSAGIEVTNLYAGFLALAAQSLRPGGQLVAITPRSFTNGPYFRQFRRSFLSRMSFTRIHLMDARNVAFAEDDVLQETVVFHAKKEPTGKHVIVSSGGTTDQQATTLYRAQYKEIVSQEESASVVRIPRDRIDAGVNARMRRLPATLRDLGISVSTGRVVEFRARAHLRPAMSTSDVPLIFPRHLTPSGELIWPGKRKDGDVTAIAHNDATAPHLLPTGAYVLVKRFTSKEERRRVSACSTTGFQVGAKSIAFENHLNVFHAQDEPLSSAIADGLAAFLNSTIVDLYFRQRSGHTQVNAADLRSLRYPSAVELESIGRAICGRTLDQAAIDDLVAAHVPQLKPDSSELDFLMAHRRITQAQQILRELGLPSAQTNERSALTLLAALNLTPDKHWSDVESPLIGVTPMMDFMAEQYGRQYAPNSRETIRRQTVHQFIEAGILNRNPDNPARPTNSGLTVYQVPPEVVALLRQYETDAWPDALERLRDLAPSLGERWRQERAMNLVSVTLPDGESMQLSPGGQNPLIRVLIEEFCPRFVPGGRVLYVGDAEGKFAVYDEHQFELLGVQLDEHGKAPDLVVWDEDRRWLILAEAVTTHGPIDPKRHDELKRIFSDADAGLVFVTAFLDRKALSQYLDDISWETEVWVADSPSHLIHFDGERFLGPHG